MKHPAAVLIRSANLTCWIAEYILYCAAWRNGAQTIFGMCCAFLAIFLSVLFHEGAHALAARAVGWRVVVFAVRPFAIRCVDFAFAFVGRGHGKTQGWVVAIPSQRDVGTRRNWSIILAAGPLMSLLLACAAFLSALTWLPHFDNRCWLSSFLGFGFALRCFSDFLFSVLPNAREGVTSDGTQLRALRNPSFDFAKGRPLIWLASLMRAKVRPRDWPDWLMEDLRAASVDQPELVNVPAAMELARFLDSFHFDPKVARKMVENYRTRYPVDEWFTAIDAYLTAVYEHDPQSARAILEAWPRPAVPSPMFLAAEAAVAAANGERKIAEHHLRSMMKTVRAESAFRSSTYCEIRRQVRTLTVPLPTASAG